MACVGLVVQVVSAQRREFVEVFTGLRPWQFQRLVRPVHRAGGQALGPCRPGRPWSLLLEDRVLRDSGLVDLLDTGPSVEILADADYQGLGGQTGGQVVTPPHRKFRKPPWYEEMHAREKYAHSSRRIRVEHGIAHLKNWRTLARHHGRCENLPETIQAVAAVVSHPQSTTRPFARAV